MTQVKSELTRAPSQPNIYRASVAAGLLAVLLFALWLRVPRIYEGSPFFYKEDEAHHFNRLIQMVQRGELNPNYFHKPSLHFYLRIPSVAASFLWTVRGGMARSIKEIVTRDPFGVGGYAFSASHPAMLKGTRLFSVLLSLTVVLLTYAVTRQITASNAAGIAAALLCAISPALIEDAAVIGVDGPMAVLCLLSVWLALRVSRAFSIANLIGVALVSGLAVSTKYNAAPIALLPLALCVLCARVSPLALTIALLGPVAGFLIGSPFILVSLPLFLDQLAYEVWHYGVAGHVGHEGTPGLSQALFYLRWFNSQALGPIISAFGVVGVAVLLVRPKKETLLWLLFPLAFFLLMSLQKANFTRNVLVLIPFVCVSAVAVIHLILETVGIGTSGRIGALAAFLIVAGFYPLSSALRSRSAVIPESRLEVIEWLGNVSSGTTGLLGTLQFPRSAYSLPGVARIHAEKVEGAHLWLEGYDRVVVPKLDGAALEGFYSPERTFAGNDELSRVVQNPAMEALRAKEWNGVRGILQPRIPQLKLNENFYPLCTASPGEDYCWLSSRATKLVPSHAVPEAGLQLNWSIMTPWPGQKLLLWAGDWSQTIELAAGGWRDASITVPAGAARADGGVTAVVSIVDAPAARGGSPDQRRLGVAIKGR